MPRRQFHRGAWCPGKYTVTAKSKDIGQRRTGPTAEVVVLTAVMAQIRLNYDTGIR